MPAEQLETPPQKPPVPEGELTDRGDWIVQDTDLAANAAASEQPGTGEESKAAAERPEWLAEKFWTGDLVESTRKLAESQAELERDFTKRKQDEAQGQEDPPNTDSPTAETAAQPDGSAIEAAAAKYAETGALEAADFEALAKSGLPRSTVENYLAGMEAMQQLAFTAAGDQETYQAAIGWAKDNITKAEADAFDAALERPGPEMVAAVKSLVERYQAGRSVEPPPVSARLATGTDRHFQTQQEMTAAIRDPRYREDPQFRAEVARRIGASEAAGVNLFV